MAKCDLSIELEDPQRQRNGGETVRGVVHVQADADVRCNGLQVRTMWATHGRGNVASGENEARVLFQGQWQAGQAYHYPFELIAARWPPTYHGHYLNVDHYVEARADIPWALDPKAKEAFPVVAVDGPEAFQKTVTEVRGCAGGLLKFVFAAIFLVVGLVMLINPFFWIFGAVIGLGSAIWWFIFRWLPKYRLGRVDYALSEPRCCPGDSLCGTLALHPPRDVAINGITWTVTAVESCVSGSGSHRTTHKHTVFEQQYEVLPSTIIRGGRESRYPLQATLPHEPTYTLDLNDNDLTWTATLRIDIPGWPDWKHSEQFQVVPPVAESLAPAATAPAAASLAMPANVLDGPPAAVATSAAPAVESARHQESTVTFAETLHHLWNARDDETQLEQIVEAVRGLTMPVDATIERRLLYGGELPAGYEDHYVVWAHASEPRMPLSLVIPRQLADDFEQLSGRTWQGRGTILGYDHRHGRVQLHVEA